MTRAPIRIYGDCRSGNCLKVRWTADALGVDYDWNEVDILNGGTRTEAFLALNPAGQVPCVVLEDGRTLAQSNAILFHLAEASDSDLIPSAPFERAKMMEWLFWEQHNHEPTVAERRYLKHLRGVSDAQIDPTLMARGRRALGRMEMALIEQDFLLGARPSLADVSLVAYTRVAHEGGFDLNEFPSVQAWVARVERALDIAPVREAA